MKQKNIGAAFGGILIAFGQFSAVFWRFSATPTKWLEI
jgi:hypothetical protein